MHTTLALVDSATTFLAATAPTGNGFAVAVRNYIGPLVLLAISLVALSFLMKRQVTQFIQFVLLAMAVATVFYFPTVITGFASLIAKAFGS